MSVRLELVRAPSLLLVHSPPAAQTSRAERRLYSGLVLRYTGAYARRVQTYTAPMEPFVRENTGKLLLSSLAEETSKGVGITGVSLMSRFELL